MMLKKSIFILTVSALLFVSSVFAWIEISNNVPIDIETGLFEVDIAIFFDEDPVGSDSPYYDTDTQLIDVDGFDVTEPNYIENLRVVVTVTAHNAARVRFRIQDEWRIVRHFKISGYVNPPVIVPYDLLVEGASQSPYNIHSDFYRGDNSPYYYYDGIIEKNETLVWTLIDGGSPYAVKDTENYYEEAFIRFQLFIDVVQANRFDELWNLEEDFFN